MRQVCAVVLVMSAFVATPRETGERAVPSAPPSAPLAAGAARRLPSIRIEHQWLRVPVTPPVRGRTMRVQRASAAMPRSHAPTFASRARRLLLGDGTYRPEPFPRPD